MADLETKREPAPDSVSANAPPAKAAGASAIDAPGSLVECNGFLLFNDPHLWHRRPSTRTDVSYGETVLGKLGQIVDIANRERLVPLCTGDWFHRAHEEGEHLKPQLLRVLNRLWTRQGISNVGNHDIKNLVLSDADTLAIIAESAPLRIAATSGPVGEFMVHSGGHIFRVGVGCTPYGQIIPFDVSACFPEADGVIWLTHHDVAFDGAYPGALVPHEIAGCAMVWNGHMHLEKEPVIAGATMWCNMGSITRTAIDAISHQPSAWQFAPGQDLVRHALRHQRDVFDLTGTLIAEISPGEIGGDGEGSGAAQADSAFVEMLQQDVETGPSATDEGTLLLQQIRAKFEADSTPAELRSAVLALFGAEVGREAVAA